MHPETTRDPHEKRRMLAPDAHAAFRTFSQKRVFADGGAAVEGETVDRRCGRACHPMPVLHPVAIRNWATGKKGATEQEVMETIWSCAAKCAPVRSRMRIRISCAPDTMNRVAAKPSGD